MVDAIKRAIIRGGVKDLERNDKILVIRALKILEILPDKFDQIEPLNPNQSG